MMELPDIDTELPTHETLNDVIHSIRNQKGARISPTHLTLVFDFLFMFS